MSGYRVTLRDRLAYRMAVAALRIATPEYRALIAVICADGVAALRDELETPSPRREPRWLDLWGIDPDYCDGKPVDEWLEEGRGNA